MARDWAADNTDSDMDLHYLDMICIYIFAYSIVLFHTIPYSPIMQEEYFDERLSLQYIDDYVT